MGVVCYTEEDESIKVWVDPDDPPEGNTFLVRNLRKAVKEECKHHYANVPAHQIPIALRGSTERLKGGTPLVPNGEYDLPPLSIGHLPPATAFTTDYVCITGRLMNWRQFSGARRQLYVLGQKYGAKCSSNGIAVNEGLHVDVHLFFSSSDAGGGGGFMDEVCSMAGIRHVPSCVQLDVQMVTEFPHSLRPVQASHYVKLQDSPETSLCTTTSMPTTEQAALEAEVFKFQRVEKVTQFNSVNLHIIPNALVGKKLGAWVYLRAGPTFHTYFDGPIDIPCIRFAIKETTTHSSGRVLFQVEFDVRSVPEDDSLMIIPVPEASRPAMGIILVPLLVNSDSAQLFSEAIRWRSECISKAEIRKTHHEKLNLNNVPKGSAWYTSLELPDCLKQFLKKVPRAPSPQVKSKKTKH